MIVVILAEIHNLQKSHRSMSSLSSLAKIQKKINAFTNLCIKKQ